MNILGKFGFAIAGSIIGCFEVLMIGWMVGGFLWGFAWSIVIPLIECVFVFKWHYLDTAQFTHDSVRVGCLLSLIAIVVVVINSFYVAFSGKDNWLNAMCLTQDKRKEKSFKNELTQTASIKEQVTQPTVQSPAPIINYITIVKKKKKSKDFGDWGSPFNCDF